MFGIDNREGEGEESGGEREREIESWGRGDKCSRAINISNVFPW